MEKLFISVSRQSLLTIYKSFARPILDSGDIIYGKPQKCFFKEKIERVQYNACLAITGAFKVTSRGCLCQELRSLSFKKQKMAAETVDFFYKIVKGLLPKYLTLYLELLNNPIYQTRCRAKNNVKQTPSRTVNFNNTFPSYCSQEWNNFSDNIKSLP